VGALLPPLSLHAAVHAFFNDVATVFHRHSQELVTQHLAICTPEGSLWLGRLLVRLVGSRVLIHEMHRIQSAFLG